MTAAKAALNSPSATDPLGIALKALNDAKAKLSSDSALQAAQAAVNNARSTLSTGVPNYADLQGSVSDAQAALQKQN